LDQNKAAMLFPSNYPILCFDKEKKHFTTVEGKNFKSTACFLGVSNSNYHFKKQTNELVQVVFKPYGVFNIFAIPQQELANSILNASDIFPQLVDPIARLENNDKNSFQDIQHIENWLLKKLSTPKNSHSEQVIAACKKIEKSHGTIPIKSLYKMVGMSERSFRYHFTEQVGVNPKTFSRIARFNAINTLLTTRKKVQDFQDIICKFDFFDQTHFINECKWYYGHTPTCLQNTHTKYLNLNALFSSSAHNQ